MEEKETRKINMNEIRRLQKAAREKDYDHLIDWFKQFDDQMRQEYNRAFEDELSTSIDNFCIAIVYALRFSEMTKFGKRRINSFMEDLFVTIDMFRTHECNPKDYIKQLHDSGITMFDKKEEEI